MNFEPYSNINNVFLESTTEEVVSVCGAALKQIKSRLGKIELVYPNLIVRFNMAGTHVQEISFSSEYLKINGFELSFAELGYFIGKNDADSLQSSGFIVSPKYGLAFDPCDKFWITAFLRADLKEWIE